MLNAWRIIVFRIGLLLFMSDYVSELRPSTNLLFFLQVIYEYLEPRSNDFYGGKPKNSEKNLSQCHI
jgi:hypothetical protein